MLIGVGRAVSGVVRVVVALLVPMTAGFYEKAMHDNTMF
jgi:hypothetical protein